MSTASSFSMLLHQKQTNFFFFFFSRERVNMEPPPQTSRKRILHSVYTRKVLDYATLRISRAVAVTTLQARRFMVRGCRRYAYTEGGTTGNRCRDDACRRKRRGRKQLSRRTLVGTRTQVPTNRYCPRLARGSLRQGAHARRTEAASSGRVSWPGPADRRSLLRRGLRRSPHRSTTRTAVSCHGSPSRDEADADRGADLWPSASASGRKTDC